MRIRSELVSNNSVDGCAHCWQSEIDPLCRHMAKKKATDFRRVLDFNNEGLRRVYRRRDHGTVKSTIHWGQRKLLISEIEFLAEHKFKFSVKSVVVYAGAAPGDHLPILINLFRDKISAWELFDPRPMSWKGHFPNVNIHAQCLDLHGITFLKERYFDWDILLISDIRSSDYSNLRYVRMYSIIHFE